jgi:hypothetical protein
MLAPLMAIRIFVIAAGNGFRSVAFPARMDGSTTKLPLTTEGVGPDYIQNIGLHPAVASKALTVSLKTKGLATPASANTFTTVTMTIASPCVVTDTAHDKVEGTEVIFTTTGALPTGLTAGTRYYVKSPTANAYNVAATSGGTAINTSGSQSGTHTATTPNSPVQIAFRNATLTTGDYVVRSATAATSVVAPSGATLGFTASQTGYVYVYALDNAGTVEAIITGSNHWDEATVQSTTAISAAADSAGVLYSTAARTNVPIRYIGRIKIQTGAVAGEWDNEDTEVVVGGVRLSEQAEVRVKSGNGHGSTNTMLRRFSSTITNTGKAITYVDSAANGASFTINTPGVYSITYTDYVVTGPTAMGISVSPINGTTSVIFTAASLVLAINNLASGEASTVSITARFNKGDVLYAHDGGACDDTDLYSRFSVTRVSD